MSSVSAYPLGPGFSGKGAIAVQAGAGFSTSPSYSTQDSQPVGGAIKRIVDVVGASVVLVLMAPMLILVAGLVRLISGGPVVVSEKRVGFAGREFPCYTFACAGVQSFGCLGTVLRESGVSELAQLFNVLRGDMSLVGPRACTPREIVRYGRHARPYLRTRPGLTGLWQTSPRKSFSDRIVQDRYYARNWSMGLDLQVLARTFRRT